MRTFPLAIGAALFTFLGGTLGADENAKRSPELQVLDRFVGTWDAKVTVKRKRQPSQTIDAVSTRKWSRRGGVLVFEDSSEKELHMSMTFDAESKAYFGAMLSDANRGLVTALWNEKTATMNFVVENVDGSFYRGQYHFVREDYAEASGFITDSKGNVVINVEFTQTRRK